MRLANSVRAAIFATGAAFLIFYQDHSVEVGMSVLLFVTATLAIAGVATNRSSAREYFVPTTLAFVVAALALVFLLVESDKLFSFRALVFVFAIGMAVYEFVLSRKAKPDDVLELRIASGLGLLAGLVFLLAPLDVGNAVGFLSAYLAISATQRAVWAASPTNGKKTRNG
jgi:hypothetical protein